MKISGRLRKACPLFVLAYGLARGVGFASADGRLLVLEDLLNKEWTREPVSFAIEAEKGECHVDSVRLRGPDGPVACQLSNVELWPGTSHVRTATLWFVTDLGALERREYAVECGPAPADRPLPAEDLRVERRDGSVEFTTSGFGVRLLLGGRSYEEPVAASEGPGPVLGMRLADGTWFGGSDLYGPTRIRAWSAETTGIGPVFGEVRYRCEYEGSNKLDLTVRLFARADRAQFDAEALDHAPDNGLRILLSRGLGPLTLHAQKLFWSKRHSVYPEDTDPNKNSRNIGDWFTLPLGDLEKHTPSGVQPGLVQEVSPWGPWWDDTHMPVVRLGIGDLSRELHIARRDPTAWVKPVGDGAHKRLRIMKAPTGEVYADVNLAAGEVGGIRRFDIADSAPTEEVGYRPRRDWMGRRAGSEIILYHEPLNEVKDYVLEWPQRVTHPHVFMASSDLEETRREGLRSERLRMAWLALKPPHTPDEKWMEGVPAARELLQASDPIGKTAYSEPHLRTSERLAFYLLTGDADLARLAGLPEMLERYLGLLGDYSKRRVMPQIVALYDNLIDTDLIPPERRRVLRAQMAYLGYQLAHPATWDNRRGWASGNYGMTVGKSMSLGLLACAIPDHPEAGQWGKRGLAMADEMLNQVGPAGEWPESSGYSEVSARRLTGFAVAATRAGFRDYMNDPRLKRFILWLAKCYTPPDPRAPMGRPGLRRLIGFGRSGGGGAELSTMGVMAGITAESDPAYSRALQHVWLGMGAPIVEPDGYFGGAEYVCVNPTLPAGAPDWSAEEFPYMGVMTRHGMGTKHEHYAVLLSGDDGHMIFGSQTGALTSLFGHGAPLGGSFWGYYQWQEEFLQSRVSIARSPGAPEARYACFGYLGGPVPGWNFTPAEKRVEARFGERDGMGNVSAFSALPRQDYAAVDVAMVHPQAIKTDVHQTLPWPPLAAGEGAPPVHWRRQMLFLKDDDPAGANYLLLRDHVRGGQPTMWTFWTQSTRLGTAQEAADRAAFLADTPGDAIVAPRELTGDRFTALGRWDVDLEFYVAEPADTPRHTLRWGSMYNYSPLYNIKEYQDLLHLQRPDDGAYYVALFPRPAGAKSPEFSTLGDGHVIRVQGAFGADWCFLSALPTQAEADGIVFSGTAASVQRRGDEVVLSLGAAGRVAADGIALEAEGAATVRRRGKADAPGGGVFRIELPRGHEGARLRLGLPGPLRAAEPRVGVTEQDGAFVLSVPAGVEHFALEQ